jgi:hypothetical protein
MPDPTPAELASLLAVICDPALSRRALGRLRPRVVGRPRPIRRLPRLQRYLLVPWRRPKVRYQI